MNVIPFPGPLTAVRPALVVEGPHAGAKVARIATLLRMSLVRELDGPRAGDVYMVRSGAVREIRSATCPS